MAHVSGAVREFFSEFQRRGRLADPGASAELFAETFLAAGPDGARAVARSDFAAVLRKRKEWLAGLGSSGAELVSLEETWLDRRYALVGTRWAMRFGAGREVEVASSYLMDVGGASPAILVYLAHQDRMSALRVKGIVG